MRVAQIVIAPALLLLCAAGCRTPLDYRNEADEAAIRAMAEAQTKALGRAETIRIESPETTLRRRLLLDQLLPHGGPMSEGVRSMPDTERWRKAEHLGVAPVEQPPPWKGGDVVEVTLLQSLQICARNSRDYQGAKEDLYRSALALDLERDEFRRTFSGLVKQFFTSTHNGDERVIGSRTSTELGITRTFRNGAALSGAIAVDLAKLLTQGRSSS